MGHRAAELAPGSRIDRYEIVGHLGGGGFGLVYAARHAHLGQTVALKLLRPDLVGSREAVERFFREARAAAAIGSPRIAQVIDCGVTADGVQPFIAMELLEGTALDKLLRAGPPLAAERAVDIAVQALEGLAAAHLAGITHRDLKPANMFLCREPVSGRDFVKLLDFGASKVKQQALEKALTRTGAWIGTPAYMAPEQFLGSRDVDQRADIYAAAVVLHEMLSGHLPVRASTAAEMAERVLTSPPASLGDEVPGLPEALCRAVERGLAKDPADRWPDAPSFAAALTEAMGGERPRASWMLRSTRASDDGAGASPGAAPATVPAPETSPPRPGLPARPPEQPGPPAAPGSAAGQVPPSPAPAVAPPTGPPQLGQAGVWVSGPELRPASAEARGPEARLRASATPPGRWLLVVVAVAALSGMLGGGLVAGAVALVFVLGRAPGPGSGAPRPPVPTLARGTALPATFTGVLVQPGQQASHEITLDRQRAVTVTVHGQGLDPTVAVLDRAGRQLGFDDDGGGGLDSRLVLELPAGQYTVQVAGFGATSGPYTCTVF